MRLLIAAALVLLAAGSTAHADAKPKLAVLDIIPVGPSMKGHEEALDLAASVLTVALRSRVMDDAGFAYHPIPKAIDQRAEARACAPKTPACWAAIIANAGADSMMYGVVERVGERIHIVVKLQQGPKVLLASFKAIDLAAKPNAIQAAAKEFFLHLLGRGPAPTR